MNYWCNVTDILDVICSLQLHFSLFLLPVVNISRYNSTERTNYVRYSSVTQASYACHNICSERLDVIQTRNTCIIHLAEKQGPWYISAESHARRYEIYRSDGIALSQCISIIQVSSPSSAYHRVPAPFFFFLLFFLIQSHASKQSQVIPSARTNVQPLLNCDPEILREIRHAVARRGWKEREKEGEKESAVDCLVMNPDKGKSCEGTFSWFQQVWALVLSTPTMETINLFIIHTSR